MKVWVGSASIPSAVIVYFEAGAFGRRSGDGMEVSRERAMEEFPVLPEHGSIELVQFNLAGNGRVS